MGKKEYKSFNFQLPEDAEDEVHIKKIKCYRKNLCKTIVFLFLNILTIFLINLVTYSSIRIRKKLRFSRCKPELCEYFYVKCSDKTEAFLPALDKEFRIDDRPHSYKCFVFRLDQYYYDQKENMVRPLKVSLKKFTNRKIFEELYFGLDDQAEIENLMKLYGKNVISIPQKGKLAILLEELLTPFYIFQLFSIVLWYTDEYEIYATFLLISSVVSISITVRDNISVQKRLREFTKFQMNVNVLRYNGKRTKRVGSEYVAVSRNYLKPIDTSELVPGDVIEVPENSTIPCDLVLLNGHCVVDESMLTGESVPILKNALTKNDKLFDAKEENKSSVLFHGTKCLETRFYMKGKEPVLALVLQTGVNTAKGKLVKTLLFPRPYNFRFYRDSVIFIFILVLIAIMGFLWSLHTLFQNQEDLRDIIYKCLDLVTITIPPAMPTCISIGVSFSLSRLRKQGVYCIDPPKINICGKLNIMCFDKTGTLTEEGLDLYGLRTCTIGKSKKVKFSEFYGQTDLEALRLKKRDAMRLNTSIEQSEYLKKALEIMGTCHSLTKVDNKLIGDPLDTKMFESVGWDLDEKIENKFDDLLLAVIKRNKEVEPMNFDDVAAKLSQTDEAFSSDIGIIRRFDFSSKLQRMSVITRNLEEKSFSLYVKGAPEKLRELCKPETIPSSFHKSLDHYSKQGFRVIALAHRQVKMNFLRIQQVQRENIEKDLIFVGFLIMINKLKPITTSIMDKLQRAQIRTLMITGDNALTAISVARQCNMVHSNQRIFHGEFIKDENSRAFIQWNDFEFFSNTLNPTTLLPENIESESEEEKKENSIILEEPSSDLIIKDKSIECEKFPSPTIEMMKAPLLTGNSGQGNSIPKIKRKKEKLVNDIRVEDSTPFIHLIDEEEEDPDIKPPWYAQSNDNFALAISGRAFKYLYQKTQEGSEASKEIFKTLLDRAQIFARMKPEHKTLLIQALQEQSEKNIVGMCGDGANDIGALRSAHIGISLSDAEASIAAPFTSKTPNISCIFDILREGKAALTTSVQCFKYMALYSMIQFISITLLYEVYSQLGDWQFMFIDLMVLFPVAIFMSYSKPSKKLSVFYPTATLISFTVLASIIGQTIIQVGFQIGFSVFLSRQDFFKSCTQLILSEDPDDYIPCYETTSIFLFANYQYLATALAFTTGMPFRESFYKNYSFSCCLLILFLIMTYFLYYPCSFFVELLELVDITYEWKHEIFILALLNSVITIVFEKILLQRLILVKKYIQTKFKEWRGKKQPSSKKIGKSFLT